MVLRKSDEPIFIEVSFDSSVEIVWKAITELDQMKRWFFGNIESFRPEVGFETKFEVYSGGRKFTHLWKITEVVPFQKIRYNWKYEEYPGDSLLTMELIEEKNRVRLRLIIKVLESFPEHIPEFSKESCIQGWHYFIGKNLKKYLEALS